MATVDLLFDASIFRYSEYRRGLQYLVEETTFSSFIPALEALNDNIKLTWFQARECWFHALDQEYNKVLSNAANMTQYQLENAGELLSRGRSQVDTPQSLSKGGWEAAEYNPGQKMNGKDQRGPTKHKRVRNHRTLQDYDPLLLLQSTSEIRLHTKRFYYEGAAKFLRKANGIYDSVMLERYKLRCVSMAQDHVKQLLKITYRAEKEAKAGQSDEIDVKSLEIKPKSRSKPCRWDRRPKWTSVWTQLREERKRIVCELDVGPLAKQSLGNHAMIRNEDKRLLRSLKPEKKRQSADGVEVSGGKTGLMRTGSMETQIFNNPVTEIEIGVNNLLRAEHTSEVELEEIETIRLTQDQIFTRMKRARRERKNHVRLEEMERRITTGWDKETHPVSIFSNDESISNATLDDSTCHSPLANQQREHGKFVRTRGTRRRNRMSWGDRKQIPCDLHKHGGNAQGHSVLALSDLPSRSLQRDRETANAETHNEPQAEERDEMDIEVPERIAKLEM